MKILIVDDEKDMRELIKLYLANENCELLEAENGIEALKLLDGSIDLVLLDSMMPKMDGLEFSVQARKNFHTPIIFLTAKSEDTDKFIGFSSGADDYITKPFNPIDLISRIKANVRRFRTYTEKNSSNDETILGDLTINHARRVVYKNGQEIKLTKLEFSIFELFLNNRDRVFSLDQIYATVWGTNNILNSDNTVSVHIRNLRNKIEDDIANPKYIKTIWGSGYCVEK